jgi:ABC-type Zn uptake system ZnuABC Zn-binding protein ZnuA
MKKLLLIFMVFLMLVSCQEITRSSKPDNLIPEDKMVEVLTEISLLHGARSYNKALMEEKGINAYPYLTKKYGIDSTQLAQSNEYYAQNYRQYEKIYERVKENLELLMADYDSIREANEKVRDSLRKRPENDTLIRRGFSRDTSGMFEPDPRLPMPVSKSRVQR